MRRGKPGKWGYNFGLGVCGRGGGGVTIQHLRHQGLIHKVINSDFKAICILKHICFYKKGEVIINPTC